MTLGKTQTMDCTGCHACCRGGAQLLPEYGDVPEDYETVLDSMGDTCIAINDDGFCVYLIDGRCSIYYHRPAQCRSLLCTDYNEETDAGVWDKQVIKEGIARRKA